MRNVSISVLLPVYDGDDPDLFGACLEAVVVELIETDQLVIVVDGQINNDLETCISKYHGSLNNFDVVRLPMNVGLVSALNVGLENCIHEYVARIDADDISLPGRFVKQVKMLDDGADVVSGAILETGGFHRRPTVKYLPECQQDIMRSMSFRSPMNHMATMFRLSKILEVGQYPNLLGNEDYGLWLKCRKYGLKFRNTREVLVKANVPVDFAKRRSGWKFARSEIQLLWFRRQNGLGSFGEIYLSFAVRFIVRLLPSKLLVILYYFLRKV